MVLFLVALIIAAAALVAHTYGCVYIYIYICMRAIGSISVFGCQDRIIRGSDPLDSEKDLRGAQQLTTCNHGGEDGSAAGESHGGWRTWVS